MPLYINGVLSSVRTLETEEVKSPRAAKASEEYFGPFIGSKTRPLFHRPNCEWMRSVRWADKIRFESHAEAVAAGRKPCKTCRA
jgi:methylphosphotriester-DNA--protein-cysteine methyltransferase